MRAAFFAFAFASLTGCGAAYISQSVTDSSSGIPVDVVVVSAASVEAANQANSYRPMSLPAAFDQTAGQSGSGLVSAALPEGPFEPEERPAAPVLSPPPQVSESSYTIGIGDALTVSSPQANQAVLEASSGFGAQSSRQEYIVQDDGAIALPSVGRIQVAGLTVQEAESQVFQGLVQSQFDPTFSLEITGFNSRRVSVGGAVGTGRTVPIGLTPLTLELALAEAGGITADNLDFVAVRVYRNGELYQIPATDLYSQDRLGQLVLVDGDSLYVDSTFDLDAAESYFAQQIQVADFRADARARALTELQTTVGLERSRLSEERGNFADQVDLDGIDRDYVYLTGELKTQGRMALPFGQAATLADAIYEGGGLATSTGNPAHIYLLRSNESGGALRVTALHLDASNAINMILATRLRLQPDDVVFVGEQPVTKWNRVVQQLVPSLIVSGVNAASR